MSWQERLSRECYQDYFDACQQKKGRFAGDGKTAAGQNFDFYLAF